MAATLEVQNTVNHIQQGHLHGPSPSGDGVSKQPAGKIGIVLSDRLLDMHEIVQLHTKVGYTLPSESNRFFKNYIAYMYLCRT